MALLPILTHPNERLHIVAQPVAQVDERIRTLVQDMAATMYASKGMINPVITKKDGETTYEEGCLSVPGIYEEVTRAETITVEFLDIQGNKQTLDADGLLAICVQHELDHLNGKLFVEYLSPLKQNRIKTKMKKRQRETM